MTKSGSISVGTSGWHYTHWKGPFYPNNMSSDEFLDFYQRTFSTVEINNTFYSLPEESTLENWRSTVAKDFLFAVKASRYITHMKKLKDPEEPLRTLFDRIEILKNKLGPILFQLPPRWKPNPQRLEEFLKALPSLHRYAFEFRSPDWFQEEIYSLLSRYNAAFCIYEIEGRRSPEQVTSDFIYIRLHGPGGAYQGDYLNGTLNNWGKKIRSWSHEGKDVAVYFDNDQHGFAAKNAQKLIEIIESKK